MRRLFKLTLLASLLVCASSAEAQGTHEFLGPPREVPDQFTAKYGIRYNTQGYDEPQAKWRKKMRIWRDNNVPESTIEEMLAFPGSPGAIGQWIDDAVDKTLAQFTACGGMLAARANLVPASDVSVIIMPSSFFEPYYKVFVAGAYYPTPKVIKVLNIYYTWEGQNSGWLRHARDLIFYEMQNYFAVSCAILPEPRTAAWPCDATSVTTP